MLSSVNLTSDNGITLLNHFTELTHNKFHTLSPSWVRLQGNARIKIASNTFYQTLEEVSFIGSDNFCTFQDNSIHRVNNKTLDPVYHACLIENVSFELPCECEMKAFPFSHRDQSKCLVSQLEASMCFSDKYVCIDEYLKSSCKDHSYVTWSECGTKINAMLIGTGLGAVILIANICFCYFSKCRKTKSSQEHVNRPSTEDNNYRLTKTKEVTQTTNRTEADDDSDPERKSGEFIIDGVGKIRVTTKVTQAMPLRSLPISFRDRIPANCVPTPRCFPKHLQQTDDDYYSNDRDFEN